MYSVLHDVSLNYLHRTIKLITLQHGIDVAARAMPAPPGRPVGRSASLLSSAAGSQNFRARRR